MKINDSLKEDIEIAKKTYETRQLELGEYVFKFDKMKFSEARKIVDFLNRTGRSNEIFSAVDGFDVIEHSIQKNVKVDDICLSDYPKNFFNEDHDDRIQIYFKFMNIAMDTFAYPFLKGEIPPTS